ncbi:lipopolysaccharide kinase InaA family protein [Pseudomonas panipatensis]|uniref:tRNA A-37 threonylcarbamoyl transferase component Bud32 n=1 Tax=Pseudomonas panipatensis TaxID=428992 RepID=A0A1G8H4N0_9PSED|nr:lipopolysaccharide kinase InaA family protein [Pseudomonas panipatensis]SDI01576.1 tRNA A-37 threonylcarbamoyl transferase component Bud32 [Pseudomonas panipatensis]SMP56464.1 tRNA A-37 threonylcarbamoyl transferase component Bud32 [Pseudomonas panipatensis]
MNDYIAADDRARLEQGGLADFAALWAQPLPAADAPKTLRGGWNSVQRLELDGIAYTLKRERQQRLGGLLRWRGGLSVVREFRNLQRYAQLGIPAVQVAFFAEQCEQGEHRAVLLTRALVGWRGLDAWLEDWAKLAVEKRQAILRACGMLARRLHEAGQKHGCLYPKNIFLRESADELQACLIGLEKTRPLWFGLYDRVKDLEPLLRRVPDWGEADVRQFLSAYLGNSATGVEVDHWYRRLGARRRKKESRG